MQHDKATSIPKLVSSRLALSLPAHYRPSDELDLYSQDGVERYTQYFEYFEQYQALDNQEAESSGPSSGRSTRTYILRQREAVEQRLMEDYFGDENNLSNYPERNFNRRYRISSKLFEEMVSDIANYNV
ncbi:hypothetical protein Tco_0218821 [Tanacetum coccineum]